MSNHTPKIKPKARCPKCGRGQPMQGSDAIYWCPDCHLQFDLSDDGGDYSDLNPAARMERQEREQQRRRDQKRGRLERGVRR